MISSPVQGACYGIEIGRWWDAARYEMTAACKVEIVNTD